MLLFHNCYQKKHQSCYFCAYFFTFVSLNYVFTKCFLLEQLGQEVGILSKRQGSRRWFILYITASNLPQVQHFLSSSNPGLSSAMRANYTKLWDIFKIPVGVVHQRLAHPSCPPKCLVGGNLLHSECLS